MFGGDIGTGETIKWFFDQVSEYKFDFLTILGNHDTFSEVTRYYKNDLVKGANEMNYVREDTHLKSIYLDSSANAVSADQQSWLKKELNTSKKIVLFIHHPVLDINTPLDKAGAALKRKRRTQNPTARFGKRDHYFLRTLPYG